MTPEQAQIQHILRQIPGLPELNEREIGAFAQLVALLQEGSHRANLTSIRSAHEIALAHFADSLAALEAEPKVKEMGRGADIGSGAGFPLFPLAIVLGGCTWVAVESIGKKCRFIEETAQQLELANVRVRCMRAEELARTAERESFDVATARAVGRVSSICEVALPLLRTGGSLLLYKTLQAAGELAAASEVIGKLGGEVQDSHRYALPGDRQERVIFRILKTASTPEHFPRAPGTPFKRPLA